MRAQLRNGRWITILAVGVRKGQSRQIVAYFEGGRCLIRDNVEALRNQFPVADLPQMKLVKKIKGTFQGKSRWPKLVKTTGPLLLTHEFVEKHGAPEGYSNAAGNEPAPDQIANFWKWWNGL